MGIYYRVAVWPDMHRPAACARPRRAARNRECRRQAHPRPQLPRTLSACSWPSTSWPPPSRTATARSAPCCGPALTIPQFRRPPGHLDRGHPPPRSGHRPRARRPARLPGPAEAMGGGAYVRLDHQPQASRPRLRTRSSAFRDHDPVGCDRPHAPTPHRRKPATCQGPQPPRRGPTQPENPPAARPAVRAGGGFPSSPGMLGAGRTGVDSARAPSDAQDLDARGGYPAEAHGPGARLA